VNRRALRRLQTAVDATYDLRDAERYTRQMAHFHLKNAQSWGNERTGVDLAAQIDPGFVLGEGVAVNV
jgi:CO dehydrogenase maturation factor